MYRLSPLSAPTKSVDLCNGSSANGASVDQYATFDGDAQKFNILASGSNWKIVLKANNAKCVGPVAGGIRASEEVVT